ncbi:MAG: hypothetical protein HQL63_03475 [Magnetococcales bacterium]|nr:hypothetical protein [Magnetococcales bacterium]MBF0321733.1 hypothetical protein [Magnetococcales bacterium]
MDIQTPPSPFLNPSANRSYQATHGGFLPPPDTRIDTATSGTFVRDKVTLHAADSVRQVADQLADQSLAKVLLTKIPSDGHSMPTGMPLHIDVMA